MDEIALKLQERLVQTCIDFINEHKDDEQVKEIEMVEFNEDGQEVMIISTNIPHRMPTGWWTPYDVDSIVNYDIHYLDDGYIEKRLGKNLLGKTNLLKSHNNFVWMSYMNK